MTYLQFIKNKKNTQRILLSFINIQEYVCVYVCTHVCVHVCVCIHWYRLWKPKVRVRYLPLTPDSVRVDGRSEPWDPPVPHSLARGEVYVQPYMGAGDPNSSP